MIIRQTEQQRQFQSIKVELDDQLGDNEKFAIDLSEQLEVDKENTNLEQMVHVTVNDEEIYKKLKDSYLGVDSDFGLYHTYLFSSSSVNSTYLYNYEFKEFENISRVKNEKALPSGLIFNYLRGENIGEGYLRPNSYTIGEAIDYSAVKNQTTSHQINQDSNLLFDKSKMEHDVYGPEIKTYKDNYYKTYTDKHLDFDFGQPEQHWLKKQNNIFVLFNPVYFWDYYPYWVLMNAQHNPNDLEINLVKKTIAEGGLTKLLFSYLKNTTPETLNFNDSEELKTWDVLNWLDEPLGFEEKDDELYLIDREEKGADLNSFLEFKFKKLIAKAELINLLIENTPTFEDIIVNKNDCKSSVIGYKIEKMLSKNGDPIQTIYYEGTNAKFLDTQLCYDKRYFYKISELRIVIGAKYNYKSFNFEDENQKINFLFSSSCSIRIVEKECQLFAYRITTPPLFSPDVEVVNELTKKNVIKFLVSDHIRNTGTYYDKFETVTTLDEEYHSYAEQAGYINNKGDAIYSHRSSTGNFEVFRIDFKPESYKDFADGFLGVFSDSNPEITDKGSSMTFTDYIKHEKIYYYMFRSLSHHGKAGKPSLVFKCELVQDADEVILKTESFDLFKKKEKFDNTKEFRKFIQILPALRHVTFKSEFDFLATGERPLGIDTDNDDDDALWDYGDEKNYFKIRIKSKKTGKKFDLNLRFKQIKNNLQ